MAGSEEIRSRVDAFTSKITAKPPELLLKVDESKQGTLIHRMAILLLLKPDSDKALDTIPERAQKVPVATRFWAWIRSNFPGPFFSDYKE